MLRRSLDFQDAPPVTRSAPKRPIAISRRVAPSRIPSSARSRSPKRLTACRVTLNGDGTRTPTSLFPAWLAAIVLRLVVSSTGSNATSGCSPRASPTTHNCVPSSQSRCNPSAALRATTAKRCRSATVGPPRKFAGDETNDTTSAATSGRQKMSASRHPRLGFAAKSQPPRFDAVSIIGGADHGAIANNGYICRIAPQELPGQPTPAAADGFIVSASGPPIGRRHATRSGFAASLKTTLG